MTTTDTSVLTQTPIASTTVPVGDFSNQQQPSGQSPLISGAVVYQSPITGAQETNGTIVTSSGEPVADISLRMTTYVSPEKQNTNTISDTPVEASVSQVIEAPIPDIVIANNTSVVEAGSVQVTVLSPAPDMVQSVSMSAVDYSGGVGTTSGIITAEIQTEEPARTEAKYNPETASNYDKILHARFMFNVATEEAKAAHIALNAARKIERDALNTLHNLLSNMNVELNGIRTSAAEVFCSYERKFVTDANGLKKSLVSAEQRIVSEVSGEVKDAFSSGLLRKAKDSAEAEVEKVEEEAKTLWQKFVLFMTKKR